MYFTHTHTHLDALCANFIMKVELVVVGMLVVLLLSRRAMSQPHRLAAKEGRAGDLYPRFDHLCVVVVSSACAI